MSASVMLRELISIDVAKELTMTGNIVTGDEAARLGLVTRAVADPLAEAQTLALATVKNLPMSPPCPNNSINPPAYCLMVETELPKQLLLTWNQCWGFFMVGNIS
jgi:enoyl-CoA hydratase/carnithine racemase